jgi:hypothetical protein
MSSFHLFAYIFFIPEIYNTIIIILSHIKENMGFFFSIIFLEFIPLILIRLEMFLNFGMAGFKSQAFMFYELFVKILAFKLFCCLHRCINKIKWTHSFSYVFVLTESVFLLPCCHNLYFYIEKLCRYQTSFLLRFFEYIFYIIGKSITPKTPLTNVWMIR